MNIYLDLETIPTQRSDFKSLACEGVKPPGTLKKPESIAAWEKDERPAAELEAIERTSFDGGMGQIVVIGFAVDDETPQTITVGDLSLREEHDALDHFWKLMRSLHANSGQRPVIVGHNVAAFDLPFMWKRSIVHKTIPPIWWPRDPKPWSESVFDTMTAWSGVKDRISLDKLCRLLDIPGKGDGPTGADVWPMVQAGKLDEVAAYCAADVQRTRAIHKRLTFA